MSRLLDLLRRADAGLAELARLADRAVTAREDESERKSKGTTAVNGRTGSNSRRAPKAAKSFPGDGGKQRRFDQLQTRATEIALRLSQEMVEGFALKERLAYAGLSNERTKELLAAAGLLLAALESSGLFGSSSGSSSGPSGSSRELCRSRLPFPSRRQVSLAVELLERMNEERTAAGQTLTKALSPRLLALIVLLAQFEVARATSSFRATTGSASGRALRELRSLRSSNTLTASRRTSLRPQLPPLPVLPLLPLLPFLQVLERNERTVAFAFLRLFGLAQWRGLKRTELSAADWNRLVLSIIQWRLEGRLEGRLEALHTDGAMVPKTTPEEVSEAASGPATRTEAAADEMAGIRALLQAAAVVLSESKEGNIGAVGNVGNMGLAAFLRIEGAWRSMQGSTLEPEKPSALTLEIRRIYLLTKSLAEMMLSAPQLRSILALALGSVTNGSKGSHGASAHGFLSGQNRRRIVRRLAKLLKLLLLDLGAAKEALVIRDPWAPKEERTVFPATDALAMERRWIWRWIGEQLWRWIEHDAALSGAGTGTGIGTGTCTATDITVATGAAGFTAQRQRLPVFELIASESLPRGNHASGINTSLPVLGHKLMLGPMASSIRQSFAKALRDIEATVTANPGLEDYYFLVINRREYAGTKANAGSRSGAAAGTGAGPETGTGVGTGTSFGSLQSLTAIFIECGRLPSAALWAADAAAAGVLLFHESTGSPQDWVTTRRTPFSGRIAEGYVFVLDANPARMFAMDRKASSGTRDDAGSRTEDERRQWQQALMISLAQFVWLSAVKKLLMRVKAERPPILTPIEEFARTAARFPTLTQSVLSPEAGFAMQGLLAEDEIARLQSMSNVSMILENQRLRTAQKASANAVDDATMPAFLRKRLEVLTTPRKGQSGARLNTPWSRRPGSPDAASGNAHGKSKAFRKHNPLNPRHPFHV